MRRQLRAASAALTAAALALLVPDAAWAELPAAKQALREVGFSEAQIQQVIAGELVRRTAEAASERELTTTMAFVVKAPPAEVMAAVEAGLVRKQDSATLAGGEIASPGDAVAFSGLRLDADEAEDYADARPSDALNLSSEELSALASLPDGDAAEANRIVRELLLARYRAYRSEGLTGIAPYDRGEDATRSPAEELRTATLALKGIQRYVPEFYRVLLEYPDARPTGFGEQFHWRKLDAHGTPTLVLIHLLWMPSGRGFAAAERQYYVSRGFNSEQAVAALLPAGEDTLLVYVNRTSTDQVTGFGGSAKRSLGSKLLASQLESIWEGFRSEAGGS